MGDSRSDNRIYIGNLPPDIRNKDLEDLFYKYGKIRYIDLKNKRGPPFAFIEFDDSLDAEDSIKGRDGYNFDGYRLRVELQKGPRNSGSSRGGYGDRRGGPPTRRSDYRCIVSGLPPTGSWQDIKDHMRVAGNVCYADVFKDGTGVCEFIRYDDMKYAVKHLDDTKFRSHEGETSYITVKADYHRSRRSMSRSYSRSRSRSHSSPRRKSGRSDKERASPSYSPARRSRSRSYETDKRRARKSYSRSRSRSRSPKRTSRRNRSESRSRSKTRSRSVSPKKQRSLTRSRSRSDRSVSVHREQREGSTANGVDHPPVVASNENNESAENHNGTTD